MESTDKEDRKKSRFPLEINQMPNKGSRKKTDFVRHFFSFDT
ncbi:pseudouridylate synthase [Ligilactobacillus ruminis]|uniref:Pseudouridylate synthase n=1 Tax=Ligilactobacillus ruminis TaxID=1623 RepID=A0A8B2Z075_9LACO|nr:pseudouridylate synthase [Ligilactobacillus ruminis]